jgi:hypothetical protein
MRSRPGVARPVDCAGQWVRRSALRHGVSAGGQVPLAVPARLEAAHALEQAVHDLVEDYIRQARQAGRTWYEIGQALDLHWRERLRRQQRSRTLTSMTCRSARRHLQQRTKVN